MFSISRSTIIITIIIIIVIIIIIIIIIIIMYLLKLGYNNFMSQFKTTGFIYT